MGTGTVLAAAALVALATGVQTVTGFGLALLAVPLLSLIIPTETAVVLCTSLGLVTSAVQATLERRHGDRPTIVRMLAGAVVGVPIGYVLLVVASEVQLRLGLVLVITTFLLVDLRGLSVAATNRGVDVAAGLVSGVLNSSLSTNGPPLVMALHARRLPPEVFRGTLTAVFVAANVVTVALFAAGGRYDADVAVLLLATLPGMGLGVVVGVRRRTRLRPERFRQLVRILLAATAAVSAVGLLTAL